MLEGEGEWIEFLHTHIVIKSFLLGHVWFPLPNFRQLKLF